jgi:hypothetical protein
LLALDSHRPPTLVSQCISPDRSDAGHVAGLNESMRCARPIRDSRIAGVVIGSEAEVSIFSKILQVRLTRDLQIARSHHHATNAVYPPASPHGVFVWATGKVTSEESGGVEVRALHGQSSTALALLRA